MLVYVECLLCVGIATSVVLVDSTATERKQQSWGIPLVTIIQLVIVC